MGIIGAAPASCRPRYVEYGKARYVPVPVGAAQPSRTRPVMKPILGYTSAIVLPQRLILFYHDVNSATALFYQTADQL